MAWGSKVSPDGEHSQMRGTYTIGENPDSLPHSDDVIFLAGDGGGGLLGAVAAPNHDVGVLLVGADPGVDESAGVDLTCRQRPCQQTLCP